MDDAIGTSASEELTAGGAGRGAWYAAYLGHAYRTAVEVTLARLGGGPSIVLKTDLWNESLGGPRDVARSFQERYGHRFIGVDLAPEVCAQARARVAGLGVVQADITALPFRGGCFDAVLDLSTLDHLPGAAAARAIREYARVLRAGGIVLLVFWQLNVVTRARLRAKRLLGRREKPGQHYLSRRVVRARLRDGHAVVGEFAAGSLLVPPRPVIDSLMGVLPARVAARLARWLAGAERSGVARPLLRHLAGLYGIEARRRPGDGAARPAAGSGPPPGGSAA